MSDYTELKRLAEASLGEWYEFGELRCEDRSGYINGLHHDDEYFIAAANPAAVLALIAEIDAARKELKDLRTDNAQLLYALKQEEQSYLVLRADRDQLRAEVAGLRTGYEAYERVNAELKAENEALRQIISDSATSCGAAVSVECTLDFMKHLPVEIFSVISKLRNALAECTNSLQGEMLQKFGGQLPEDMHPFTRREYDRDIAEVSGYRAALGQGEQS
jgi:cell division protein FtsB